MFIISKETTYYNLFQTRVAYGFLELEFLFKLKKAQSQFGRVI